MAKQKYKIIFDRKWPIIMNLDPIWQNKGDKQKADENFQKAFQLDTSLKR